MSDYEFEGVRRFDNGWSPQVSAGG